MVQAILQYLTTRNSTLEILSSNTGNYTQHEDWAPIESISTWDDFNYSTLIGRYGDTLDRKLVAFDSVPASEDAGHNIIGDEAGFSILLGATNITKVSCALPKPLFLAAGSRIISYPGVRPDWGAGNTTLQYAHPTGICHALICGDTKLHWDVQEAIRMVNEGNYENRRDARRMVRPLEQIQHYCTVYQTRYGFIITNEFAVIIRVRLSPPTSGQGSLRPNREMGSEGHRRILSDASTNTDISDSFSAMSFRPKPQDEDVGALDVVVVPWKHKMPQALSINLALFCLVLLADEERGLSHQYAPLENAQGQSLGRSVKAKSKPDKTQTYWFPSEGIAWDVISTDVQVYLPGATVQRARHDGRSGYRVQAAETSKDELTQMLSDLKADTQQWRKEGGAYEASQIKVSRHHWKGSWAQRG